MKKTKSKADLVRTQLLAGVHPKEIAKNVGVSINRVYTIRWEMKKQNAAPKKRIVITKSEADLAKKLRVPLEAYARKKLNMPNSPAKKLTPLAVFVKQELENVESQISRLQTIASFLFVRLEQIKQNGE